MKSYTDIKRKRIITPHKGGRTARVPSGRMTPHMQKQLRGVLKSFGMNFSDWIEYHVALDAATEPAASEAKHE